MTRRTLPKFTYAIHPLLVAIGFIALAAPSSPGQAGTATTPASLAPANTPYVATMTFDVASVRENKTVDINTGFTMSGGFVSNTATYRSTNWMIENLLSDAYGVRQYQIVGAPKWPWPTLFAIEAKGGRETDAKMAALTGEQQWAEKQHMVRALLEDRFKLKAHWETREGDVYNLVVAKGGPKLGAAGSMPLSKDGSMSNQHCDGQGCEFILRGCSMDMLVENLAGQFGRPVIDKTGLTAKYDFVLKYKGRWDMDRDADDQDPAPPLERALREELGLKVEAAKGPVKILVVDHIEKPSEN